MPELEQVADPATLLAQLRATSETMPPELRRDLVAAGSAAIPGLVAILQDPELAAEDSPCQGWPPIHAVDLLVEVHAEVAIEPMLSLLREGDLDEILSSRIAVRLPRFGAAALEPLLTELASTTDPDRRLTLCEMLSSLSLRDERVWKAISAAFDGAPVACAGFLARYGDPRGASMIEDAFYGFNADPEWALYDLRNLVEAYETLAGPLPDELAEHVEALLDRFGVPAEVPIVAAKVGRNDPCPCGSGKKYKRCCLE